MSSTSPIKISCPSRIHFGLLGVGQRAACQFGGVGLMVAQPRAELLAWPADKFECGGDEEGILRRAAEKWFQWQRRNWQAESLNSIERFQQLPVRLELRGLPPRHQGLGTGTQIAFATALALLSHFQLPVPNAEDFAAGMDRGKRSAIGSYGFFLGGLLVDRGKSSPDQLSPLDFRTDFPGDWPILIFLDRFSQLGGLSGASELAAFEKLKETEESQRQEMVDLVRNEILSGVLQRNYQRFAEGVYQFGNRSGQLFESVQQGIYHSPQVAELIDEIRNSGVPAVGQSSWGPGVFAILPAAADVNDFMGSIEHRFPGRYKMILTEADNGGAILET